MYKGNEKCNIIYEHDGMEDEVRKDFEINSSSQGIIIDSSWFRALEDNDFDRTINYMGIAADVDNYFAC